MREEVDWASVILCRPLRDSILLLPYPALTCRALDCPVPAGLVRLLRSTCLVLGNANPAFLTAWSVTEENCRFLATLRRKTYPGRVRRTADPSATLRSGRDDKERATVEREWSPDRYVFHHLGWAAGPYNTQDDDFVAFWRKPFKTRVLVLTDALNSRLFSARNSQG